MRILHTADWHLGKRLEHYSRLPEQREVMEEIIELAEEHAVDMVLIAGDLFDTFNPGTEAEDLFYRTLKRLSENGKRPIIAIAGNHDSPDRIEVPNPLARENGIFFAGYPHSEIAPIVLDTGVEISRSEPGFVELKLPAYEYPARLLLTPYANEYRLRQYLGSEKREDHLRALLEQQWSQLADKYCDEKGINLLMTHLFMIDKDGEVPEEPEEEKPILHVGGAQAVFTSSVPNEIQYVALGHLHRHIRMTGSGVNAVYSGSPLAYSFKDADLTKHIMLVELEPGKDATLTKQKIKKGLTLKRVRFPNVDEAIVWLHENPDTLVELSVELDAYLSAGDRKRIHEAHKGIINIVPLTKMEVDGQEAINRPDPARDLEELFISYFKDKTGQEPNVELLSLFREIRAKHRTS
jgi:exonuclease SbcD